MAAGYSLSFERGCFLAALACEIAATCLTPIRGWLGDGPTLRMEASLLPLCTLGSLPFGPGRAARVSVPHTSGVTRWCCQRALDGVQGHLQGPLKRQVQDLVSFGVDGSCFAGDF